MKLKLVLALGLLVLVSKTLPVTVAYADLETSSCTDTVWTNDPVGDIDINDPAMRDQIMQLRDRGFDVRVWFPNNLGPDVNDVEELDATTARTLCPQLYAVDSKGKLEPKDGLLIVVVSPGIREPGTGRAGVIYGAGTPSVATSGNLKEYGAPYLAKKDYVGAATAFLQYVNETLQAPKPTVPVSTPGTETGSVNSPASDPVNWGAVLGYGGLGLGVIGAGAGLGFGGARIARKRQTQAARAREVKTARDAYGEIVDAESWRPSVDLWLTKESVPELEDAKTAFDNGVAGFPALCAQYEAGEYVNLDAVVTQLRTLKQRLIKHAETMAALETNIGGIQERVSSKVKTAEEQETAMRADGYPNCPTFESAQRGRQRLNTVNELISRGSYFAASKSAQALEADLDDVLASMTAIPADLAKIQRKLSTRAQVQAVLQQPARLNKADGNEFTKAQAKVSQYQAAIDAAVAGCEKELAEKDRDGALEALEDLNYAIDKRDDAEQRFQAMVNKYEKAIELADRGGALEELERVWVTLQQNHREELAGLSTVYAGGEFHWSSQKSMLRQYDDYTSRVQDLQRDIEAAKLRIRDLQERVAAAKAAAEQAKRNTPSYRYHSQVPGSDTSLLTQLMIWETLRDQAQRAHRDYEASQVHHDYSHSSSHSDDSPFHSSSGSSGFDFGGGSSSSFGDFGGGGSSSHDSGGSSGFSF